jgi:RimJ/RimL family protein N-acetyltransferase
VEDADLPILFEHQADPVATAMAAFPARDRVSFMAHWASIVADRTVVARTILAGDTVVGTIVCWIDGERREVGYWIGRAFWGRGYATRALALLLEEVAGRPLFAHVAEGNIGSRRVLEHCGFVTVGEAEVDGVREATLRLD